MWSYSNPVSIHAGDGALSALKKLLGNNSYGIVTYRSAYFSSLCDELTEIIGRPPLHIVDGVEENPSVNNLRQLCDEIASLEHKPQMMIALGGGSAIDSCKVLCAGGGDFDKVYNFIRGSGSIDQAIEFICIPTTAGTGSEVTCWATVWDPENDKKYSLSDASLYPVAAILEPRLTHTLPLTVTVSSGLDALSHAMESLWNVHRNPLSRLYAEEAIRELICYLPRLANDINNQEARERVQQASMLAGLAFSNTKTSIAHSISYAVTLEKGLAHGLACSFTLPTLLRANVDDPFIRLSIEKAFLLPCEEAAEQLENMLQQLGISTLPSSYGYRQDEWQALVDNAIAGERGKNYSGDSAQLKSHFDFIYQQTDSAQCL
ncbi:alcohol dehydrogenase [Sinobacterium caligoides]|uniref:Alcohol dehydrogenase n=1 Tax=Sinobacterium caligoides TaxID=933926 RepID=A0A3N2DQG5_9GAMM|nr:phosphonoacetaldehyde reductase [Sinobacterium caligoides]ROS02068.1 alcohol dehydrogenase [Sinobacterium caligoides]